MNGPTHRSLLEPCSMKSSGAYTTSHSALCKTLQGNVESRIGYYWRRLCISCLNEALGSLNKHIMYNYTLNIFAYLVSIPHYSREKCHARFYCKQAARKGTKIISHSVFYRNNTNRFVFSVQKELLTKTHLLTYHSVLYIDSLVRNTRVGVCKC